MTLKQNEMTFLKTNIIPKKLLFNLSILLFSAFLINASFFTNPKIKINTPIKNNEFLLEYLSVKYPEQSFENFIYVGVKRQKLDLYLKGNHIISYPVSTSKHGAGTKADSDMTPVGLHKIRGKFGSDTPIGGILKARKYTGKIASIQTEAIESREDVITTRVLTLEGLESGINKGGELDSYERHIYIHGTAEEGLIGQPASHGCVRMKNEDVIDLFNLVDKDLTVIILNN
jgi:lipoprotein-anchoring transpeptidase ErfK/SrfK